MKGVGYAATSQAGSEVFGALQDEGVVTVAVEPVVAAKSLIDEYRLCELVAQRDGGVQSRVIVVANGVVQPAEHELSLCAHWACVEQNCSLPQQGWQVIKKRGWVRTVGHVEETQCGPRGVTPGGFELGGDLESDTAGKCGVCGDRFGGPAWDAVSAGFPKSRGLRPSQTDRVQYARAADADGSAIA